MSQSLLQSFPNKTKNKLIRFDRIITFLALDNRVDERWIYPYFIELMLLASGKVT